MRALSHFTLIFVSLLSLTAYAANPTDVVLILDTSGSMGDNHVVPNKFSGPRIDYALVQSEDLLNRLANEKRHNVGVIHFMGGNPILARDMQLLDSTEAVAKTLASLRNVQGGTPLARSIDMAGDMLASSANKHKTMIVISDGQDDRGAGALYDAIDRFNRKVDAQVFVYLIADQYSLGNWTEFQRLSKIIIRGTLVLIPSGSDNGTGFKLTYDSISGEWDAGRTRQAARDLVIQGHVHADHVKIASGAAAHVRRDKQELATLDWVKLCAESPNVCAEYQAMLKEIEAEYLKTRMALSYRYMLEQISQKTGTGKKDIVLDFLTNRKKNGMYAQTRGDIGRLFENLKKAEGFSDTTSTSSSLSSAVFLTGGAWASENSAMYLSLYSGLTMNYSLRLNNAQADRVFNEDFRGFEKDDVSSIGSGSGLASLLVSSESSFDAPIMIIPFLSMSSSASGGSGQFSLMKSEDSLKKREEAEIHAYNEHLHTERARHTLNRMFPTMGAGQIDQKIIAIKKTAPNSVARLRAIFGHDQEMLKIISDSEQLDKYILSMARQPDKTTPALSGLRRADEWPFNIEAYLKSLTHDVSNLDMITQSSPETPAKRALKNVSNYGIVLYKKVGEFLKELK